MTRKTVFLRKDQKLFSQSDLPNKERLQSLHQDIRTRTFMLLEKLYADYPYPLEYAIMLHGMATSLAINHLSHVKEGGKHIGWSNQETKENLERTAKTYCDTIEECVPLIAERE